MIVGLTGGIATGKTTVSNMLVERGAILVDADRIAREVVLPGSKALQQIVDRFGQEVLQDDGSLDRQKLGAIVFSDGQARKDLEAIVHPAIRKTVRDRLDTAEKQHPDRLIVADIPLLFENKTQYRYPEVVLAYVPETVQLQRLMQREGFTREQAIQRIKSQLPIEEKKRLADVVIDNSGSLKQTQRQVDEYLRRKGLL